MKNIPSPIAALAAAFSKLPGVGGKTALRYAYSVVDMSKADAEYFCRAVMAVKDEVRFCKICGNLTDRDECGICTTRDTTIICVVAYPKDLLAIEKAGYKGVYHVLHGTLSPMDGRGPNEIRIKELLSRIANVKEVIMATNPDVEGEATAMYIARLLSPMGVKVSRIAQGISMGSDIEYADEVTLGKALEARVEIG